MKVAPRVLENLAKFEAAVTAARDALSRLQLDLPRNSAVQTVVKGMVDTLWADDGKNLSADRTIQAIVKER